MLIAEVMMAAPLPDGILQKHLLEPIRYATRGTDVLTGDPLGGMNITAEGILRRDGFVFQCAIDRKIPILLLLSGGYTRKSAGEPERNRLTVLPAERGTPPSWQPFSRSFRRRPQAPAASALRHTHLAVCDP